MELNVFSIDDIYNLSVIDDFKNQYKFKFNSEEKLLDYTASLLAIITLLDSFKSMELELPFIRYILDSSVKCISNLNLKYIYTQIDNMFHSSNVVEIVSYTIHYEMYCAKPKELIVDIVYKII